MNLKLPIYQVMVDLFNFKNIKSPNCYFIIVNTNLYPNNNWGLLRIIIIINTTYTCIRKTVFGINEVEEQSVGDTGHLPYTIGSYRQLLIFILHLSAVDHKWHTDGYTPEYGYGVFLDFFSS